MLKRWNILALALFTMLAIAAAACGGDDDDSSAGNDDGDEPTATRTAGGGDDDDSTPGSDDDDDPSPDGDDDATPASDDDDDDATPDGDDDDGPTPLSTEDTCDLLTEDEVERVLGAEVIQSAAVAGGCTYITEEYATLGLSLAELGDDPEEEFNLAGEFLDAEEVGGVGDDAFWLESLKQLQVRVGRTQIFLTLILVEDLDDPIDTASGLVERVISRLD